MRISDWSSDVCSADLFPFLGIADARLGLDVVEPGVLHALARGPHVLAGDRTGMAAAALVQVHHHGDLRAHFHDAISSAAFAGVSPSIQSLIFILRSEPLRGGKEVVSRCRSRWS